MSTNTLDMSSKFIRNLDLVAVPMDGDLVMMSISQGSYYGVNPVGSVIWEALQTPQTLEQLCQVVVKEFAVDADTCVKDVQTFVTQMLDAKVVQFA
ncbi:PqqD family peptide modification chaperone [Undibacterium sp. SXout11W]|uniref:PqqD family peptide modification chaperone n=1 Tax=Undibacterium sp. SXout11W TaxID=3413050 RepID=UPI003BF447B0